MEATVHHVLYKQASLLFRPCIGSVRQNDLSLAESDVQTMLRRIRTSNRLSFDLYILGVLTALAITVP